ncbi:MAG: hypothetical protein IJH20_00755 [Bacilli bacterium]|nr:hypothetical protein [Bacilli bacterium]
MNYLANIKRILDSDAGLIIEDMSQPDIKKVVDNRFSLIKQSVERVENKDDNFYTELVKLISNYINELCDKKIEDFPIIVFDENSEEIAQEYDELNSSDMLNLTHANKELSKKLFEYVCSILEVNKDVKLDIETLKKLLNRNPKLFTLSVEESYLYRTFDYKKLIKIINENGTLEKSNISIDDIYQILFDTCQLNNQDVFCGLVTPEQFSKNHKKIDEMLSCCNAKAFVEITNIITRNFDKKFDRLSFAKNRSKDKFCERLIIELLYSYVKDEDCNLIHQILTDSEIQIDYDRYYADYKGQTNLKSLIALSKNPIIIKDLLSKEQNVQDYYWHGESGIQLFRLYGIIGDYEKALTNFNEKYNYGRDYTEDFDDDFNRVGHTYGGWDYEDSVAVFVNDVCTSFNEQNTDYSMCKAIINKILNNDKVKYINLEETLPVVQEILSDEDFKALLDTLVLKRNSGNLGFIVSEKNNEDSFFNRYVIRLASEEEVQDYLSSLNKKEKAKVLSLNPTKKDD